MKRSNERFYIYDRGDYIEYFGLYNEVLLDEEYIKCLDKGFYKMTEHGFFSYSKLEHLTPIGSGKKE